MWAYSAEFENIAVSSFLNEHRRFWRLDSFLPIRYLPAATLWLPGSNLNQIPGYVGVRVGVPGSKTALTPRRACVCASEIVN